MVKNSYKLWYQILPKFKSVEKISTWRKKFLFLVSSFSCLEIARALTGLVVVGWQPAATSPPWPSPSNGAPASARTPALFLIFVFRIFLQTNTKPQKKGASDAQPLPKHQSSDKFFLCCIYHICISYFLEADTNTNLYFSTCTIMRVVWPSRCTYGGASTRTPGPALLPSPSSPVSPSSSSPSPSSPMLPIHANKYWSNPALLSGKFQQVFLFAKRRIWDQGKTCYMIWWTDLHFWILIIS